MKTEILSSVDSTNVYIKKYLRAREDVAVRALTQTGGKGTKGRSFLSDYGGIYMSKLSFYDGLYAKDCFKIMINSCMAVVKTLLCYGIKSGVKWPNDVLAGGKKICGILIENSFFQDEVDYSIVGIGLNVNNAIDDSIKDIATSMKEQTGKQWDEDAVFMTLLANLSTPTDIDEYRNFSLTIGKNIVAQTAEGAIEAFVSDITDDGRLCTDKGVFSSAEIIKIR